MKKERDAAKKNSELAEKKSEAAKKKRKRESGVTVGPPRIQPSGFGTA